MIFCKENKHAVRLLIWSSGSQTWASIRMTQRVGLTLVPDSGLQHHPQTCISYKFPGTAFWEPLTKLQKPRFSFRVTKKNVAYGPGRSRDQLQEHTVHWSQPRHPVHTAAGVPWRGCYTAGHSRLRRTRQQPWHTITVCSHKGVFTRRVPLPPTHTPRPWAISVSFMGALHTHIRLILFSTIKILNSRCH